MKRSKGFTLIELLAVIVILAIIALIATPLVLKYIAKSREGANEASVNSVLRAAENYYLTSKLNNNTSYPITLDLTNEDDIKKLSIKGSTPTDGIITIDKKGNIYLEAIYGEIIYVKLPNEEKITKNPMVIGDYKEWITDGNGTITEYIKDYNNTPEAKIELLYCYIHTTSLYALRNEETEFGYKFDYTKDLYENIELMEQGANIDRSNLPQELNNEIDIIIEFYNTDRAVNETEVNEMFYNNASKIPYSVDFIEAYLAGDDITQTNAYKLIEGNTETSTIFIIPNYVKHEDGALEKIKTIGDGAIGGSIKPTDASVEGKDVVISYGIENIGAQAFYMSLLNSVTFSSTVKTIGAEAFSINKISKLNLPPYLETIGESAFTLNNIQGKLIIPNNVVEIGRSAFNTYELFNSLDECSWGSVLCNSMNGVINNITEIVFEENSKIESIYEYAFKNTNITSVTIPASIKFIGNNAFESDTLTSAVIKKAKGEVNVRAGAFGNIKPIYEP